MSRAGEVYWNDRLAGVIRETDEGYEFAYDHDWLESTNHDPISLTLPIRTEPYRSSTMIAFIDGLIPEGWLLSVTVQNWKLDPRDRLGLLLVACKATIGAVSIRPLEDPAAAIDSRRLLNSRQSSFRRLRHCSISSMSALSASGSRPSPRAPGLHHDPTRGTILVDIGADR